MAMPPEKKKPAAAPTQKPAPPKAPTDPAKGPETRKPGDRPLGPTKPEPPRR